MVATETKLTSNTQIVASPNAADAKRRRVSGEMPTTFFSGLSGPEDPILGLRDRYIADPHPSKLSVAVGAYRTEEGKPLVLECVREAEAALLAAGDNKEYLPVDGLLAAHEAAARLVLGDAYSDRVYSAQTLSGTGGLSLAARVVGAKTPGATVYVPAPTWPIHYDVFRAAGLEVASYRYYDASTCALDFGGLCADLEALPLGAAVVLHACAHNPTGADPTPEQWRAVGAIVQRRRLLPIFDVAYLGMGNRHGDIDDDACAARDSARDSSARNSWARNSSARFSDALPPPIPPAGTRCATSPPSATSRCSSSSRSPRTWGCTASASAPSSPSAATRRPPPRSARTSGASSARSTRRRRRTARASSPPSPPRTDSSVMPTAMRFAAAMPPSATAQTRTPSAPGVSPRGSKEIPSTVAVSGLCSSMCSRPGNG